MTQLAVQHVDPFKVADPSELSDWRLPLSFMKPRHGGEASEGEETEESWRMKDRVSSLSKLLVSVLKSLFVVDENLECCARSVPQHRRRPTRRSEDQPMCPERVLDR